MCITLLEVFAVSFFPGLLLIIGLDFQIKTHGHRQCVCSKAAFSSFILPTLFPGLDNSFI